MVQYFLILLIGVCWAGQGSATEQVFQDNFAIATKSGNQYVPIYDRGRLSVYFN